MHEGSNDNDGSVCGSDSAFYRQSEGERCREGRAAIVKQLKYVKSEFMHKFHVGS